MVRIRRQNQKTIYFAPDVDRMFDDFFDRYPRVKISDVVNESLRLYLEQANQSGVDGNLKPLISERK